MITSVTPLPNRWGSTSGSFAQGSTLDIIITGDGFTDVSTVFFSSQSVHVVRLGLLGTTALEVTISIDPAAPVGPCDLTVVTGGQSASLVAAFSIISLGPQWRYPVELITSPFNIQINTGNPVYDHSGVYFYRILALPIVMNLTFTANGPSFVEVFDADNQRFLLGEKVAISSDTTFPIQWDGTGAFEPRIWKDSHVTAISLAFQIPGSQIISNITPRFNLAPYVLGGGLVVGTGLSAVGLTKRKR